jgi:hypothetical protein
MALEQTKQSQMQFKRCLLTQNESFCTWPPVRTGPALDRTYSAIGACLLGGTRVPYVISLDPRTGAQPRPPAGAGRGALK